MVGAVGAPRRIGDNGPRPGAPLGVEGILLLPCPERLPDLDFQPLAAALLHKLSSQHLKPGIE